MANAELPFFNPAAGERVDGRDDGASDPAIAAAFAAFHRGTRQPRRHLYLTASVRFLRGTGGAIVGLTAVAFAGGLFLAYVPVSGPERSITIGAVAPETIYRRPMGAESRSTAPRERGPAAVPDYAVAMLHDAPAHSFAEEAGRLSTPELPPEAEQMIATASRAQNLLPEATANFAAAMHLNAIGGTQNGGSAAEITSGFAAEELPSVPEPAAGWTIAIGLATLLGLQRCFRRRGNNM
ncbi:MAG: hypothetical protein ABR526_06365 [Chthoniobacterales bacterium]